MEKGRCSLHKAGKHPAKNNGTTTAEWLVFTKKNTALPDCGDNTVENDVTSVSPNFAQSLFNNDDFGYQSKFAKRREHCNPLGH